LAQITLPGRFLFAEPEFAQPRVEGGWIGEMDGVERWMEWRIGGVRGKANKQHGTS
jgi:hypothetical protein